MTDFCLSCHGDGAPGASTNVMSGVFDGGPTSPSPGGTYQSNSEYLGALNGGGFARAPKTVANDAGGAQQFAPTTSMHAMDTGTGTDPLWGAGNSVPDGTNLTCTDCHDSHGSSNYRALRDALPGDPRVDGNVAVGGYVGEQPYPLVVSAEVGYPEGGWLKHEAGAAQMLDYRPNYTTAEYKYNGVASNNPIHATGTPLSISTWCAGCHERYDESAPTTGHATYDYVDYEAVNMSGAVVDDVTQPDVSPTATIGARPRHRHPVNMNMAAGTGPTRALALETVTSTVLPLEYTKTDSTFEDGPTGPWSWRDYIGCLTCHRAHGVSSDMTGWAEARYVNNPSAATSWYPERLATPVTTNGGNSGVNPNFSSALLRADNRGVCERCHNK